MACTCSRKLFEVLWGEAGDELGSRAIAPSKVENMPHVYPSSLNVEHEGGFQTVQTHQLVAQQSVLPGQGHSQISWLLHSAACY